MHVRPWLAPTALALCLAGTALVPVHAQDNTRLDKFTPVTKEILADPPDSDWLHWRRTYDGWGYSPLDQIDRDNVKDLTTAWTWSLTPGATETTPLVRDGILYVHNNLDTIQALDGATGDLLWQYVRDLPPRGGRCRHRQLGLEAQYRHL